MNTHSKTAVSTRDFQRDWLRDIAVTLEVLIANPFHKHQQILSDVLDRDFKTIRARIYPENEKNFKEIERRFLFWHDTTPVITTRSMN